MLWFKKRKEKKKEYDYPVRDQKPACPECGNKERVGMIFGKWYCFEHNKEL